MNYGLSAAAISGRSGMRRWVEMALGGTCLACHSLPALAESRLCSQNMPPQGAWRQFDGPTTNCDVPVTHRLSCFTHSTHKRLQSVMASGLAPAWERPMGHAGVSCVDAWSFRVCQGSCQAVLSNTQPRKSSEGWRSRTCTSSTELGIRPAKQGPQPI